MNFQELKAIALANTKGKIVARDATGNDAENVGSWFQDDCNRDVVADMVNAAARLSSMPSYLIGGPVSLCSLLPVLPDHPYPTWFLLIPLFKDGGNLWEGPKFFRYDFAADPGIVLLVGTEGDVVYIDTR
jgi:hypothetical protein